MSSPNPVRLDRERLEIALLGPPTFRIGDVPYVFKAPPLCLPLLAYLLVHRRSTLQRTAIAYLFWPDDDEEEARGKLRRHLHRLQAALPDAGEPWLSGDTRQVQWNANAPASFDVDQFEECSARGSDPEAAIALYRGDFLDGRYEDWVFPHRERLRALQIDNFTVAIARRRSAGDVERAVALARNLLALDPWREHTVRLLMNLRYELGDRAGALTEFETFARRLDAEMQTAPMAETVATYEDIVRRAVIATGDRQIADDPVQRRRTMLPFAGRVRELELAQASYAHAAAGHGRALVVSGEAGIGKSRFVREVAARLEAQGASVYIGTTSRREVMPYQAIVEALRAALPVLTPSGGDGAWRGPLAALIPELDDGTGNDVAIEPGRRRTQLFEAVSAAFERLAAARPCAIVLEDLHWAGATTLEMLEYVIRRLARRRALVVATYRAEEASRAHPLRAFRRALEHDGRLSTLPLPRLANDDVRTIVREYGVPGARGDELADELFRQSEGNGLFLWQVLQNRLSDGEAAADLTSAMRGNFERLDPAAQSFAQTAAVAGDAFDVELVIEITKWPEHEALTALDALLDAGFVREASALRRRDYAFAHHALQTFVYDTIPESRRRREHLRAALALPELYASTRAELHIDVATHYERSGSPERAALHFARAAERALAVFANEEAAAHAVRAAQHAPDAQLRFEARAIAEEAHRRLAMRDEQQADLDAMARDAAAAGGDARLDVLRRTIKLRHATGEREGEAAAIADLRSHIGPDDAVWRAEADCAEAALRMRNGELTAAMEAAARAVNAFRAAGATRRAVEALGLSAEAAAAQGDFRSAEDNVTQGRELAASLRDPAALAPLLNSAASAAFWQRDFDTAMRYGDELLEICRRTGDREGEADANARLATLFVRARTYVPAEKHYNAAERLYTAINKRLGRAVVQLNKGCLLAATGDPETALASWYAAIEVFESLSDMRGQALCLLNMTWVLHALRRLDEALDTGRRADAIAADLGSPMVRAQALGNLGQVEYELGDTETALRHMRAGLAMRPADSPEIVDDYVVLGPALLSQGQLDEAVDVLRDLESRADVAPTIWDPQDLWWTVARIRRAAGDKDGYRVALDRAVAALEHRLAAIDDPARRDRLRTMRFNPEILAAAG